MPIDLDVYMAFVTTIAKNLKIFVLFSPLADNGKVGHVNQANNMYLFPGFVFYLENCFTESHSNPLKQKLY